ncbi:MAG: hypothetical protein ACFFDF_19530 [Candidatus Odinarchaeota archaeon]
MNPLFIPGANYYTRIHISRTTPRNFRRIFKWDYYDNNSKARNLDKALHELRQISSRLQLPYSVKSHTILLYRKILKKNLIRGRFIRGMICACLYYISRIEKYPLTLQELTNESGINIKILQHRYLSIIKEMKLKVPVLNPGIYMSKYCNELKLDFSIEQKALGMLKRIPSQYFIGKDPKAIIGAIIYSVCKKERLFITQDQVAEITGMCVLSIRSRFREIEKIIQDKILNLEKKGA